MHALSVAIKSFTLVLMLNFGLSNCQDIFGLLLCFDGEPHLVGLLVNLLNHLDQSVTGGHDWETFLSSVTVWRAVWPSRCDIPRMALSRKGAVVSCGSPFTPGTFTRLEQ